MNRLFCPRWLEDTWVGFWIHMAVSYAMVVVSSRGLMALATGLIITITLGTSGVYVIGGW
ncbi:MAG: hypothetical protein EOP83_15985 [Verrucomicrobiaceae bacterium]|nr:MAG: hypothetical protein EOP83_15985 [Verrucomicrobiaceae bacterium]